MASIAERSLSTTRGFVKGSDEHWLNLWKATLEFGGYLWIKPQEQHYLRFERSHSIRYADAVGVEHAILYHAHRWRFDNGQIKPGFAES